MDRVHRKYREGERCGTERLTPSRAGAKSPHGRANATRANTSEQAVPVHLALVSADALDALDTAWGHLVDDLAQAMDVYERMACGSVRSDARDPRQFSLNTIRLDAADLGGEGRPCRAALALASAYGITDALEPQGGSATAYGARGAAEAQIGSATAPGARSTSEARSNTSAAPLYALALAAGARPAEAATALSKLACICRDLGIPWGGGVAMSEGELVARCAAFPRMGRMRRARSEHIDLLIAAIRSDCSVQDIPQAPTSGIICTPSSLPAVLYPLTVRLLLGPRP